jgi:hypothetical protein
MFHDIQLREILLDEKALSKRSTMLKVGVGLAKWIAKGLS